MRSWLLHPKALVKGVLRAYGVRGLCLRCAHEARRRFGWFREKPRYPVAGPARPLSEFRLCPGRLQAIDKKESLERANRIVRGDFFAFGWDWRPLPKNPTEWHVHPNTGRVSAADVPWWRIEHLDQRLGDIKDIWEPGRFGWVYDLVRAYVLTGDEQYVATFQRLLKEWADSSPAFRGVHWSCGQETAIRVEALLYAEANLAGASSSSVDSINRLVSVLAASGERIADAIGYAVSQRNNHAMSEAVGLILLGRRFAGEHPEADAWLRKGRSVLEQAILEQFADDGWYSQNSLTYMRVALDQCVLAERSLAAAYGGRGGLSNDAKQRIAAAVGLLMSIIDSQTGHVPNRGPNDGALVHPISLAPYRDFRPIVTAVCSTFGISCPQDIPADATTLAWLDAPSPLAADAREDGVDYGKESGWVSIRVGKWAAFLRCSEPRFRPAHADMMHVDIRWNHQEIIVDPGTYSYNADGMWHRALGRADLHNGVVPEGSEVPLKGPGFLILNPVFGAVKAVNWNGITVSVTVEIPNKARRTVYATHEGVTVEDNILCRNVKTGSINWLLHPQAECKMINPHAPYKILCGARDSVYGWFFPSYGNKIKSKSVHVRKPIINSGKITTVFRAPIEPEMDRVAYE